jgi:outer membrane protein assembly factor BamA
MNLGNDLVDGILDVIGFKDYISSGLGLTIEYDTRNNIFLPTYGFNIGAEYMVYDDKIGSDWNYSNFNFDGEGYVPIAEKWILAFAGNYQYFSTEHLIFPPTIRPYVALRGVPAFRYQGDEVASFQTQLTYMLTHRWLISGFYGIGFTNTPTSSEIFKREDTTDSVNSYGVGFRYQIARRYGLYIGADIALSDEDSAFYINVGSGF